MLKTSTLSGSANTPMSNQSTLERTLRALNLLQTGKEYDVKRLARIVGVKERTVYRYLQTLRNIGYPIISDKQGKLQLQHTDTSGMLALNNEEEELLKQAVLQLTDHPLRDSVLTKIQLQSGEAQEEYNVALLRHGQNLVTLNKAIKLKVQAELRQYASVNGNRITDRLVEPIELSKDFRVLNAYDIQKGAVRDFRINRINWVILTDSDFEHSGKHVPISRDVFGIQDENFTGVTLGLSIRAGTLLLEQFPDAERFLTRYDDQYYWEGPVNGKFIHIDRFLLSVIDEINSIQPAELVNHLRKKINSSLFGGG